MQITRGKIESAQKVVVYGPEGIGKSTFAAQFPNPIFIDTEGSTKHMDVARFDPPTSWQMLLDTIAYVCETPNVCETLVVDTVDWAEQLCVENILAKYGKSGIEDFGYGNGYIYVKEEFGRLLNRLNDVVDRGIHVVLTAHSQIRKFEQPDEMGAYDRYELKLGKKTSSQTSPLVKEWADMLLFANYKTLSVVTDKDGKKHKGQGGKRVMYTSHHPCWDAKNRHGLPEEVAFDYGQIMHCFMLKNPMIDAPIINKTQEQPVTTKPEETMNIQTDETKPEDVQPMPTSSSNLPKSLTDLMRQYEVTNEDIQKVVASKGYFTVDVPVEKYNEYQPGFVEGVLVAAWPQVFGMIEAMRMPDGFTITDEEPPSFDVEI